MNKIKALTGLTISFITILVIGSFNHVSALSASAQGIQISPATVEINAERGGTRTITLNVMNITASDLVYSESVVDFNSSDETGSPHIIENSTLDSSESIVSWVSDVPQFSLASGKSKTITVSLNVPSDAEPGGHYGVIRFSGTAPDLNTNGVGLSASAGTLILVKVDGDVSESASLSSFTTVSGDKQSSFFENSPISFVTRIKNDGNMHVKPSGVIEIKDVFGNLVSSLDINKTDPKSNVLPGSIRRFDSKLENKWLFGMYTANLVLGYGSQGQTITSTITFWVIPYKLLLLVIIILVAIVFIFKKVIDGHNKRVIAKYKNENSKKPKDNSKKAN